LLVVLIVIAPAAMNARAQDGGLSDEQQALLERVIQARENYQGYSSLVEEVNGGQARELILTMGDNQRSFSTVVTWERSAQIIQGEDGRNIAAMATATIVDSGIGPTGEVNSRSRTVIVDLRLVDGQLYLLAEYGPDTSPDLELPELPEGWFVVEKLSDWSVLEDLNLQDLVEQNSIFDNPDSVREAATDVMLGATTLEDGTPVDMITFTVDAAGLRLLLGSGPDTGPMSRIIQRLDDDSGATLAVILDADDKPYEVMSEMVLHATGLDASLFGMTDLPAGTSVEFETEFASHEIYSQINETLEPAAVPEELAD
jgi:hypothetical protein